METNVDELLNDFYEDDTVTDLNGNELIGDQPEEVITEGHTTVSGDALLQQAQVSNYLLSGNIYLLLLLLGLGCMAIAWKMIFEGILKNI